MPGLIILRYFDILVLFGNYAATVINNSSIYTELKNSYVSIIKVLAKAIDAKDTYPWHCERVKELSLQIGNKTRFGLKRFRGIGICSFLHDIGKLAFGIILYKPGH